MNKFSAEAFWRIGCLMGNATQALDFADRGVRFEKFTPENVLRWMIAVRSECEKISLVQSAKSAGRIISDLTDSGLDARALMVRFDELQKLIFSEMEAQLFLWVPTHRSEWFGKRAEDIVGQECCQRFPSIVRETEEAAKCYAVERYTASAFHLTRATEAGMQAIARAINFSPQNNNWNLVFRRLGDEFAALSKQAFNQRPIHWQSHGSFLETVWADLRAVSKAWRNDIAHLVDTYSEHEAKDLISMIPIFLRDLSKHMDEMGTLY